MPPAALGGRRVVDGHVGGAGLHDAEERRRPPSALFGSTTPTRSPAPTPRAARNPASALGAPIQLGVGQRAAAGIDDGGTVRPARAARVEVVDQVLMTAVSAISAPACAPRAPRCLRCDRSSRCPSRAPRARCRTLSRRSSPGPSVASESRMPLVRSGVSSRRFAGDSPGRYVVQDELPDCLFHVVHHDCSRARAPAPWR